MSGRGVARGPAAAAVSLAACGLVLLAVTQPWAATVTQTAPGAPLWRGVVLGGDVVPWLAPVVLVAALAVVAGLARFRWGRAVAAVCLLAALVGTVLALIRAAQPDGDAVSSRLTAWPWISLVCAVFALLAALLWRPHDGGRRPPAVQEPPTDVHPGGGADWEELRRRAASDWRALSEDRDPGDP